MRLRRGGRKKETAVDSSTAAPLTAAGLADEPRPIQPPPTGSVLGLSTASSGGPAAPTDEWGLYDPDLAGVGALLSTLDTAAISFPDSFDQDPGELLLRQQISSAKESIEALPSVLPGDAEEANRRSQAATAVASCRVPHLAPLSLWARVVDVDLGPEPPRGSDRIRDLLAQQLPKAASRSGSQFVGSGLAVEIGRLMHPALVAMTGLSPACRIRGIRTTEPAAAAPETSDELPGWPQPDAAPAPELVTLQALEGLDGRAEPAAPQVPDQVLEETVAEESTLEPTETGSAAAQEVAQVCEELGVEPEAPLTVEASPDAETADDLGIIVAPPALEALAADFMMIEAPPEAETGVHSNEAAVIEPAPAAETAAVAGQDEPGPVQEPTPPELPPLELPPLEPALTVLPPQVAAPPAKRRRRTAVALG